MTRLSMEPRTQPSRVASADAQGPRADHYSLWLLTIAPAIWAVHLLASYITAAIWCAKFVGPDGSLGGVRSAIAWYTAAALAGIALMGWEGYRRHRHPGGTEATTHDLDSMEDRHRFLGFAALLLAGLSAVGVLYAALAAAYFETCQ
jgi:hypothetical protein